MRKNRGRGEKRADRTLRMNRKGRTIRRVNGRQKRERGDSGNRERKRGKGGDKRGETTDRRKRGREQREH